VNDRIVRASFGTKNEIIGLLLGRLQDDTIIIEDSITGKFSAEPHRVTLPSSALAKIADSLLNGRVKGNIVGWYHSHTEGGLFFSETDVSTQRQLQQFSSLITGMVVDALTGDVGYFRVDPRTGKALRLPGEKIKLYNEPSEAIPPEAKVKPRVPTPTVEVRRRAIGSRQPTNGLIISAVVIVLVASLAVVGVLLYRGFYTPTVTIGHTPISTATIGTPIEVEANVTGPIHNATLVYALMSSRSFTQVLMNPVAPGTYAYLIPGDQVTGNIAYYISVLDGAGNKVSTGKYYIAVADFNIIPQNTALTVYRNSTKPLVSELSVLTINGFTQSLSLSATGGPQGMNFVFSPNPATGGTSKVGMRIEAGLSAPNGTTSLTVSATYAPPQSQPVTRQMTLTVTVADFDLEATPALSEVFAGSTAKFDLTLTLQKGFADPVTLTVLGLPQGARYELTTSSATVLGGGPGTTTISLQITTPISTQRGTYTITINAAGAGVSHSRTVQLTVR
jgi:proteasome lid subunit RPN8/RPN11